MQPLLYGDLVEWYYLIDPTADHREDAELYRRLYLRETTGDSRTLLELGAGGGNSAFFLKADYACTLTDVSPQMQTICKNLNPECEHVVGDMRTLRLGRTFDAVLVHDAICYMATRDDLRAAARTAFEHTRPGGVALIAPDCVRETYVDSPQIEGVDGGDRSLRCLMWTWDPDPRDETYQVDFAFLLRDGATMKAVHDQHTEGLFPRAVWLEILQSVGFEVRHYRPVPEDGRQEELFICRRP